MKTVRSRSLVQATGSGDTRADDRTSGRSGDPSDESLLEACGRRDDAALGTLFDRHSLAVYRFFARYTGVASNDFDELVNATFLEVHHSAARFRGHAAVRTWILAVAANVARHHVRGESRRSSLLRAFREWTLPTAPSPAAAAESRDLVRKLGHAVEKLPHDLRVVFVMCDLEEIPGVDVARALQLPQGTVWRRLHDARQTLREALVREGRA